MQASQPGKLWVLHLAGCCSEGSALHNAECKTLSRVYCHISLRLCKSKPNHNTSVVKLA